MRENKAARQHAQIQRDKEAKIITPSQPASPSLNVQQPRSRKLQDLFPPPPPPPPSYAEVSSRGSKRQMEPEAARLDPRAGDYTIFQTFFANQEIGTPEFLNYSKNYINQVQSMTQELLQEIKEAWHDDWLKLCPVSRTAPKVTDTAKQSIFKTMVAQLTPARVPSDLKAFISSVRQTSGNRQVKQREVQAPNGFFQLPGLLPGRRDFGFYYTPTLGCAHRHVLQALFAVHLPDFWKMISVLEHNSDNTAKLTKFAYAPRAEASDYECALHILCVFLAEESMAYKRFLNDMAPDNTFSTPMVQDCSDMKDIFSSELLTTMVNRKGTTPSLRNVLIGSRHPFTDFNLQVFEEKKKWRKMFSTRQRSPGSSREHTPKQQRMNDKTNYSEQSTGYDIGKLF